WFAKLDKLRADLRDAVGSGPVIGEKVDFEEDFGIRDGPQMLAGFRALLGYRKSLYLRGGYQELGFRGGTTTERATRFAGYTIPADTFVDTSARFDFFEVGLQYNLIDSDVLRFGLLAEPKFMNLRLRVSGTGQEGTSGPLVPFYEKEEEFVIMPLLGLALELRPLDYLGIRGEIKGLSIPNADSFGLRVDGRLRAVDAEVGVSLVLSDALALTGGYRLLRFDLELEDSDPRSLDVKAEFSGWFVAIDLRF
ncbi:MAG: hypothetical protein JXQ29_17895, partial [Planctomycetes bacterium]|nr:hypothetical protein [Planctomycetota bacterium]